MARRGNTTSGRCLPGSGADEGQPRLTVEIIPTSLHGKNPRTAMGKAMWERQRKRVCEAAGDRCELCGGVGKRHPVQIHERYEYDEV